MPFGKDGDLGLMVDVFGNLSQGLNNGRASVLHTFSPEFAGRIRGDVTNCAVPSTKLTYGLCPSRLHQGLHRCPLHTVLSKAAGIERPSHGCRAVTAGISVPSVQPRTWGCGRDSESPRVLTLTLSLHSARRLLH